MITLKRLIKVYGSQANVSRVLGISSQAISQWPNGVAPVLQQVLLKYAIAPEIFGNARIPIKVRKNMSAKYIKEVEARKVRRPRKPKLGEWIEVEKTQ